MPHYGSKAPVFFVVVSCSLIPIPGLAEVDQDWCAEGRQAFEAGKYEQANLSLSSCLHVPPEDAATAADGYFMRGVTYLERSDLVAALGDFDHAIELSPVHALAWQQKAWVHYSSEELHPAVVSIEESLELDPNNTRSHHIHALILTAMGRPQYAMDAYDLAYSFEKRVVVKRLQRALQGRGYNVGAIDGNYGGRTREALKSCIEDRCSFML